MDTDILIVGAGPTGLMLANQLARRGIRAMIIDRHSGPAQQSRAMAVQARTLEIYAKMGIVDQAKALGKEGAAANMWSNGRPTARIPIGDMGRSLSPFPFVLMLGQDDNERIMGESLRVQGVGIAWNTELVAMTQHPDHVAVTLKEPDGTNRDLRAAWVMGCDGSRSPVREFSGITFPGAPYEQVFFVADTEATGSMRPGELNVYLWKDGFHLFFPMRGTNRWRVIGILPEALRKRDGLTFDDVVPALRQEAGTDLLFTACNWFSTYKIHHRAAERFRSGRCFLLGDAAHVHSPMGAQGMNTGLQDAYNLAWKLALVVQDRADPALLDSYEAERIPVARRLLSTTDRAFQLVVSDGWLPRLFRTRIMARAAATAMKIQAARKIAFRTISQIGVSYPASPLSRTLAAMPKNAPKAGERFPWIRIRTEANGPLEDLFGKLDDTCFSLLVFGSPESSRGVEDFGGLVRVHRVEAAIGNELELARAGIPQPSAYLLRPDGHVGLCGPRLSGSAIGRYLSEQVHLRLPDDPATRSRSLPPGERTAA